MHVRLQLLPIKNSGKLMVCGAVSESNQFEFVCIYSTFQPPMHMLQRIPVVSQTIWTPTARDVWMRWYFAGRRGVGVKWCEELDEAEFLLASLPRDCGESGGV